MYSGSTLTTYSGRILGAHQKIDRVARRHLQHLAPGTHFPAIRRILHFEGGNGPDAIKRKSPAKDEPWHYFRPFDPADTSLLEQIGDHYALLVQALRKHDEIRAAFEAAWLAHAMVDGLTPAHHFPYEETLVELRGGQGLETRRTVKEKIIFPGETLREQAKNNWGFWGPKGLFTSHFTFEWGVATSIIPLRFRLALPTKEEIDEFREQDITEWFRALAQDVEKLGIYDHFLRTGWTIPLSRKVRKELAPRIVKAVTLAWYGALYEARRST